MAFNLHSIKRQARKEAWYSDSWNPFRKTMKRSSTWNPPSNRNDIENNPREIDTEPLSAVQTEPAFPSNYENDRDAIRPSSKDHEMNMTSARTTTSTNGGKVRDVGSDETAVEKAPVGGVEEGQPRHRFNPFAKKDHVVEDDDAPKKRPWYKGKILKHKPYTLRNQIEATILNSWINVLLLAAPAGIAINYAGIDGKIVFCVNFVAIIPLAGMLGFATEEIALHVGESLGGLLNASFGNAVELIVAIIALFKEEYIVVQTSLIGSILSNLLLVMGMCFFFGGLRRTEQFFNQTVAQTAASLLALAVGSVIIPTCFDLFSNTSIVPIAKISRGTSVILLVVYGAFLYFQLSTHKEMFNIESQKVAKKPRKNALPEGALAKGLAKVGGVGAGTGRPQVENRPSNDELLYRDAYQEEEEEPEEPQLHIVVAWATLAISTAIIGICAEFMVDGIASITKDNKVPVEFVGLILLPIVGNAAEHATAVTVAIKDKMDLAIGVAVGSSMQISLGVIPLIIVIGWIAGKEGMTLSFDGFQVAVLFVAVLLVNYLIGDGKSHWLEGMLLMCLYLIIAVCAWYYPAVPSPNLG